MSALLDRISARRAEHRRRVAARRAGVVQRPFAGFHPSLVPGLVGAWNADDASVSSMPNELGGTVGAFAQGTPADQPTLIFTNGASGARALRFDGSSDDMNTSNVAALKSSPRMYLAAHIRLPSTGSGHLFAQWGASAERIRINYVSNTRFEVFVAIDATTAAQRNYNTNNATLNPGVWLEMLYDGDLVGNAKLDLVLNSSSLTLSGSAGTLPATLQAGDAAEAWLASLDGSGNWAIDVRALYIGSEIPSGANRTNLRDYRPFTWA